MSISSLSVSRVFPTIANDKNTPHGKSGSKTMVVECSSRPQKKGTSHHMKTRPKKSQPWDINRKPTVYAPLPPLPPDWTLFDRPDPALNISSSADDVVVEAEEEEASLSPA